MKLTAPVYILMQRAKDLKRAQSITMVEALNQIAKSEGFLSWSLLQSKAKTIVPRSREEILDYLNPGDLVLIGARPGLGKTTLTLQIMLQAAKADRLCLFFSFEYTDNDIRPKLTALAGPDTYEEHLRLDFSDDISADYIIKETKDLIKEGSLIAMDYLQLLDQKRSNPALQQQIEVLKEYAKATRCILIFISQIDRKFTQHDRSRPTLEDVRLPNPLDLRLFNKAIFVEGEQIFI